MPTFTCLITDDRYSAPSLALFHADHQDQAAQLAWRRLMESEHHKAVELLDGDQPVYSANRSMASPGSEPAEHPAAEAVERDSKDDATPTTQRPRRRWWFLASPTPAWYERAPKGSGA